MKKIIIVFFYLYFASFYTEAENSPYKINDSEIDLLFAQSVEVQPSQKKIISFVNGTNPFSHLEDSEEKRITAGILGILLGGLGIHRFYLGHSRAALIGYCLPSVCAGLGYIPGIIDGVLYLIATDEEFNKKYKDNQKIWVWL